MIGGARGSCSTQNYFYILGEINLVVWNMFVCFVVEKGELIPQVINNNNAQSVWHKRKHRSNST